MIHYKRACDIIAKDQKAIIVFTRGETVNRIFLGDYTGTQKTEEHHRHQICFSRLEEVGITEANWLDFTSGGPNPVRYISK